MANDIPLEKVLVSLFKGDKDELKRFYPAPVGYNFAIRHIVHEHVLKLREQESRQGVNQDVGTLNASDAITEFVRVVGEIGAPGLDEFGEPSAGDS